MGASRNIHFQWKYIFKIIFVRGFWGLCSRHPYGIAGTPVSSLDLSRQRLQVVTSDTTPQMGVGDEDVRASANLHTVNLCHKTIEGLLSENTNCTLPTKISANRNVRLI